MDALILFSVGAVEVHADAQGSRSGPPFGNTSTLSDYDVVIQQLFPYYNSSRLLRPSSMRYSRLHVCRPT